MNSLKQPFAIVAFLISIALLISAYADLSTPAWGPVRQFLTTINPVLTGFLGFWVVADTQRKVRLADDYLADLAELSAEQVRLFYEIRRTMDKYDSFEVPSPFVRENHFHNELRKLRRARLISGTESSRFKAGRRFVLARWTDRLRALDLKTSTGMTWRDIERQVDNEQLEDIKMKILRLAAAN